MSKGVILPAMRNSFGEYIINKSEKEREHSYWETADVHFLSVLGFYVANEYQIFEMEELLYKTHEFLKEYPNWNAISEKMLSTENQMMKESLMNDALFHVVETGWEEQVTMQKNMMIGSCYNRLSKVLRQLEQVICSDIFYDKNPASY